MTASIEYWW